MLSTVNLLDLVRRQDMDGQTSFKEFTPTDWTGLSVEARPRQSDRLMDTLSSTRRAVASTTKSPGCRRPVINTLPFFAVVFSEERR